MIPITVITRGDICSDCGKDVSLVINLNRHGRLHLFFNLILRGVRSVARLDKFVSLITLHRVIDGQISSLLKIDSSELVFAE